jgi:hypothetical protein
MAVGSVAHEPIRWSVHGLVASADRIATGQCVDGGIEFDDPPTFIQLDHPTIPWTTRCAGGRRLAFLRSHDDGGWSLLPDARLWRVSTNGGFVIPPDVLVPEGWLDGGAPTTIDGLRALVARPVARSVRVREVRCSPCSVRQLRFEATVVRGEPTCGTAACLLDGGVGVWLDREQRRLVRATPGTREQWRVTRPRPRPSVCGGAVVTHVACATLQPSDAGVECHPSAPITTWCEEKAVVGAMRPLPEGLRCQYEDWPPADVGLLFRCEVGGPGEPVGFLGERVECLDDEAAIRCEAVDEGGRPVRSRAILSGYREE